MKLQAPIIIAFVLGQLSDARRVHVDIAVDSPEQAGTVQPDPKNPPPVSLPGTQDGSSPSQAPVQVSDGHHDVVVDLPYERHRGFPSSDGKYISFYNIPYAAPATGRLRFAPPHSPDRTPGHINSGRIPIVCPQPDPPKRALVNESCLYLNVKVPRSVWEQRDSDDWFKPAVIVSFFGDYVSGHKDQYSPEGLFDVADKHDEQNIIHVSANYRLGVFGWLTADKLLDQGGVPNIGLQDQHFALEWVNSYIQLFGGDRDRVVLMGQGIGATNVALMLAYHGGHHNPPNIRGAVIQSPVAVYYPNATNSDLVWDRFLQYAGAKDLEKIRDPDFSMHDLIQANNQIVKELSVSSHTANLLGPVIDDRYIKGRVGQQFSQGSFIKGIPILLGKTGHDSSTECTLYNVTQAIIRSQKKWKQPVYRYSFNVLPADSGSDLPYTYYRSGQAISNATFAKQYQSSIVQFVRYLEPNPEGVDQWKQYDNKEKSIMNWGAPDQQKADFSQSITKDETDGEKCGGKIYPSTVVDLQGEEAQEEPMELR